MGSHPTCMACWSRDDALAGGRCEKHRTQSKVAHAPAERCRKCDAELSMFDTDFQLRTPSGVETCARCDLIEVMATALVDYVDSKGCLLEVCADPLAEAALSAFEDGDDIVRRYLNGRWR